MNHSIGFDARPLFRQRDGIGTYTEQTILAAAKLYPKTQFLGVIFKGDNDADCLIGSMPKNVRIATLPFSWRAYRAFAELGIWARVDKYINTNLSGFIYFNFVALPRISDNIPKHLIVHDATYLKYPETVSKKNLKYLSKYVPKSLNQPNVRFYTISNHSAKTLNELLLKDFKVAPPGASPLSVNKKQGGNGSFLFVGTLEPRKNLTNLVRAYCLLDKSIQSKHPLIIAGKDGWMHTETLILIDKNKFISRIISPSDQQLATLYKTCSYFVMPSIYEGFGIPVIDASNFGIPVITSKDSPMQEILGDKGAIYVDPASIDSIKNALENATKIKDHVLRVNVTRAQANVKKFSWDNTAAILFGDLIK